MFIYLLVWHFGETLDTLCIYSGFRKRLVGRLLELATTIIIYQTLLTENFDILRFIHITSVGRDYKKKHSFFKNLDFHNYVTRLADLIGKRILG